MMTDWTGMATLVAAVCNGVAVLIGATVLAYLQVRNSRKVDEKITKAQVAVQAVVEERGKQATSVAAEAAETAKRVDTKLDENTKLTAETNRIVNGEKSAMLSRIVALELQLKQSQEKL